jgi:hypothetical protein
MAVKTTLEKLEAVQAAIAAAELGQSVTIDGDQITRANLDVLYRREDALLRQYKTEQGTGGMTINVGIRRRD